MNEQQLMQALRRAMLQGTLDGIQMNPEDPRWINAANSILANNKELLMDDEAALETQSELADLLKFVSDDEEAA